MFLGVIKTKKQKQNKTKQNQKNKKQKTKNINEQFCSSLPAISQIHSFGTN